MPPQRSILGHPSFEEAGVKLDALAASVLVHLAPICYTPANTDEERMQIFRLRYRAVIDRGWASPEDFSDGIEREADDERAVLIGAWKGATPVATARLIFPSDGNRLPVESLFEIDVEPRGKVVQADRITVNRAHSDRASRLLLGLIARCWLEMRSRGFHVWTGIESAGMMRLYRSLGFEMTVLGPARRYWDEDRFPVRFDPIAVAPSIIDRLGSLTSTPNGLRTASEDRGRPAVRRQGG